jgi:NAD(P)-dependent dehydrogenase (short-subunit alcohol dehydrogenase family)
MPDLQIFETPREGTAMRLNEQVAIVTGASRGIGAAIASALAEEGARVVVSSHAADPSDAVAGELVGQGLRARTCRSRSGERVLAVNLTGPLRCSEAVGRHMLAVGRCVIVNIGSVFGAFGMPTRAAVDGGWLAYGGW